MRPRRSMSAAFNPVPPMSMARILSIDLPLVPISPSTPWSAHRTRRRSCAEKARAIGRKVSDWVAQSSSTVKSPQPASLAALALPWQRPDKRRGNGRASPLSEKPPRGNRARPGCGLRLVLGGLAVIWPAIALAGGEASRGPRADATEVRVRENGSWLVARYSRDGRLLRRYTGFGRISDIAVYDSETLLVAEGEIGTISALGSEGAVRWEIRTRRPRCVQALASGNFLVCQERPLRVVEVHRAGQILGVSRPGLPMFPEPHAFPTGTPPSSTASRRSRSGSSPRMVASSGPQPLTSGSPAASPFSRAAISPRRRSTTPARPLPSLRRRRTHARLLLSRGIGRCDSRRRAGFRVRGTAGRTGVGLVRGDALAVRDALSSVRCRGGAGWDRLGEPVRGSRPRVPERAVAPPRERSGRWLRIGAGFWAGSAPRRSRASACGAASSAAPTVTTTPLRASPNRRLRFRAPSASRSRSA